MVPLDVVDGKLLNLVQTDFPLTVNPYIDLAKSLSISADEVVRRIKQLRENKVIRMIGPVLDARSLGYRTTLVAMKVTENGLEKAERVIIAHPGVSHGYEREYEFNIWFTLALPQTKDFEIEIQKFAQSTGAETVFSLPAVKVFKIGAYFDMNGIRRKVPATSGQSLPNQGVFSDADKLIINILQQDIPMVQSPFSAMAEKAGMDEELFLAGCQSLRQRGIIRRYGASINHRNAGFTANAMSCWIAPQDKIDTAGRKLASLKEVSHCYERQTNRLWQYNLFAMIHGHSIETCREIADKISRETGIANYILLFSTKEFKKMRVKYLV